jgi:hypothetical protein
VSINPSTIPAQPYVGTTFSIPSALGQKSKTLPRVIPITIPWLIYGVSQAQPNAGVTVNLKQNSQTTLLDAIRGCYIDNTGSDGSIYVYFPDTGHTVTCAPFATAWQPVLTNSWVCNIYGKGFGTDDASQTTVYLSNQTFPPAEIEELNIVYPQYTASPSISRGLNIYSNGFASPALGDQFQFNDVPLSGGVDIPVFGTPYSAGGTITLTDFSVNFSLTGGSTKAVGSVTLQSTGASGILWKAYFGTGTPEGPMVERQALQYKLNAAELWEWAITTSTPEADCHLSLLAGYSYKGSGSAALPVPVSFGFYSDPVANSEIIAPAGGDYIYAGMQFAPAESFNVTELLANYRQRSGSPTAYIYTDSGGSPGTLIATFLPPVGQTFMLTNPIPFIAGGTYWIVMTITGAGNFFNANWANVTATGFASAFANTLGGLVPNGNIGAGNNQCWSINGQTI